MRISDWSSDVCSSDLENVSYSGDLPPRNMRMSVLEMVRNMAGSFRQTLDVPLDRVYQKAVRPVFIRSFAGRVVFDGGNWPQDVIETIQKPDETHQNNPSSSATTTSRQYGSATFRERLFPYV